MENDYLRIQMLGQVSAGDSIEWLPLKKKSRLIRRLPGLKPGEIVYGMDVIGNSLIDRHIVPGDVLIFVTGRKASPGQLCVVQTPFGVSAKFVFPREDEQEIVLRAASKFVADQVWPVGDVGIIGIVERVERDVLK